MQELKGYSMPAQQVLEPPTQSSLESQKAWLARLDDLIQRIQTWGTEAGWATRRIEKPMKDSEIGRYIAPGLLLQEETTRVLLEPIARDAPGVEGVVDLYLMPAYDDIANLYFSNGEWQLQYVWPGVRSLNELREIEPQPISKAVLQHVLNEMKRHAANV